MRRQRRQDSARPSGRRAPLPALRKHPRRQLRWNCETRLRLPFGTDSTTPFGTDSTSSTLRLPRSHWHLLRSQHCRCACVIVRNLERCSSRWPGFDSRGRGGVVVSAESLTTSATAQPAFRRYPRPQYSRPRGDHRHRPPAVASLRVEPRLEWIVRSARGVKGLGMVRGRSGSGLRR